MNLYFWIIFWTIKLNHVILAKKHNPGMMRELRLRRIEEGFSPPMSNYDDGAMGLPAANLRTLDTSWLPKLAENIKELIRKHGYDAAQPFINQVVKEAENIHKVVLNINVKLTRERVNDETRRSKRHLSNGKIHKLGSQDAPILVTHHADLDALRARIKKIVHLFGYESSAPIIAKAVNHTEEVMKVQLHVKVKPDGDSVVYYLPKTESFFKEDGINERAELTIESESESKETEEEVVNPVVRVTQKPKPGIIEPNWKEGFLSYAQQVYDTHANEELATYLENKKTFRNLAKSYGVNLKDLNGDLFVDNFKKTTSRKFDGDDWQPALKSYIRNLATSLSRSKVVERIEPVIAVLEKKHHVSIKDIDVDRYGEVNVTFKKKKKRSKQIKQFNPDYDGNADETYKHYQQNIQTKQLNSDDDGNADETYKHYQQKKQTKQLNPDDDRNADETYKSYHHEGLDKSFETDEDITVRSTSVPEYAVAKKHIPREQKIDYDAINDEGKDDRINAVTSSMETRKRLTILRQKPATNEEYEDEEDEEEEEGEEDEEEEGEIPDVIVVDEAGLPPVFDADFDEVVDEPVPYYPDIKVITTTTPHTDLSWYTGKRIVEPRITTPMPEPAWADDFRLYVTYMYHKQGIQDLYHHYNKIKEHFERKYNVEIEDFEFDVISEQPKFKIVPKNTFSLIIPK